MQMFVNLPLQLSTCAVHYGKTQLDKSCLNGFYVSLHVRHNVLDSALVRRILLMLMQMLTATLKCYGIPLMLVMQRLNVRNKYKVAFYCPDTLIMLEVRTTHLYTFDLAAFWQYSYGVFTKRGWACKGKFSPMSLISVQKLSKSKNCKQTYTAVKRYSEYSVFFLFVRIKVSMD